VGRWGKKLSTPLYADIFFILKLLTLELSKSTVGAILREINFDEGTVIISSLERPGLFLRAPIENAIFCSIWVNKKGRKEGAKRGEKVFSLEKRGRSAAVNNHIF
jgi:hypothetical protein